MESQEAYHSSAGFASVLCEAEDDSESEEIEEGRHEDIVKDSRTQSRYQSDWSERVPRYLKQSDSQTAAALLLLRQRQIALGDMISGACLKCFTADIDIEDETASEDEDLADLLGKRKLTLHDFSARQHLLRPLRTDSEKTFQARISRRFPLTRLFREATSKTLLADVLAGATVSVMGVPESLSYAQIAGLPFEYGLYALIVPQLVYSFIGQSRQLMVGPVAMLSLLLRAGLEGGVDEYQCPMWHNQTHSELERQREVCQEKYIDLAILQTLLSGCVLTLCCVLQLGFLLKFLGHPVISGFSSGSAIVIMMHQLKNFLGVKVADSEFPILKLVFFAKRASEGQPITLGFGLLFTFGLVGLRKVGMKCGWKVLGSLGPLLSCVCGVLLIYLCKPLQHIEGLEYMKEIPGGSLPCAWTIFSRWTWWDVRRSLPLSVSLGLIGFLEAFATAKSLAKRHGYEVESGQELLALGMSNIAGSIFTSYPASGSFSRSAVCSASGGVTQLSGIVSVLLSLLALLYLTPLFYYLPKFVLAAIVVSSVSKLVAYDVAINLFKIKKSDFVMWMTAFVGTLCLGPLLGIGLAVMLSLAVVIYESVHPQIQVLWRIEGTCGYRPVQQQDADGTFIDGIFIVRIGASLYFANVAYVEETLRTLIADMNDISRIHYLVLDFTPVTTADYSAIEALSDVLQNFREKGVQVAFACISMRLEGAFERFGLLDSLGEEWRFHTVHEAVLHCTSHFGGGSRPSLEQEMDIALSELKRAEARVNELRQLWAGSAAPNVGKR
ncbi:unnamed protein product [Durusdinium trenchii]|uniref:STAS domain-containing protein n=2 Tax=Durusdinium trenchii TaxID=1381693 RepID=A0ABP0SAU3_9DINO